MGNKIIIFKSGLIAKDDAELGLIIFSKYSGQFFVCHHSYKANVIEWLNGTKNINLVAEFVNNLGQGWAIPRKEAVYPTKHFLPDNCSWGVPVPSSPIVINWLLTGNCNNKCIYCYADDLMHGNCSEPGKKDIERILKTILSYNPLVVVLTGGDPLLSPFLREVIKKLHNKTGIIVDTSGTKIDSQQAELFKKYNVFVRVSIDSEIPKINDKIRITNDKKSSCEVALRAICVLLNADVSVGVQTVATYYNWHDLHEFGIKLDKLGVFSWRILMVSKSKSNSDSFSKLSGPLKGQRRHHKRINEVKKYPYSNGMTVQVTHSYAANSVVLVSPDGTFLTESVMSPGKMELDLKYPKKPRKNKIFEKIDSQAHGERYLGEELRGGGIVRYVYTK
jgi:MoaA/NifB/PqqE/SkfB family radical SAM enzyme